MKGVAVRVGIHRHGGDTHLAGGFDDAAGDLAAVGNKDLLEHLRPNFCRCTTNRNKVYAQRTSHQATQINL